MHFMAGWTDFLSYSSIKFIIYIYIYIEGLLIRVAYFQTQEQRGNWYINKQIKEIKLKNDF